MLRGEWGFDGVVMSDWGAVRDRVAGVKAVLDLEMPGDTAVCRRRVLDAVADGSLPMEDLDSACRNILRWIDAYAKPADPSPVDWDAHHPLAADIAALLEEKDPMAQDGTDLAARISALRKARRDHREGPEALRSRRVHRR